MRHLNPTKVFISAHVDGLPDKANEDATRALSCELSTFDGISHTRLVEGTFNGKREDSFCCFLQPGSILETIEALADLGLAYLQDSVLVVHGDNAAELIECGTSCNAILGRFQAVDAPEPGEDYTFADGRYYVVR